MRRAGLLAGLFLVALSLRPQLVGAGPLLPAIEGDLSVSHAVAGLLGTIPVLCMGLFAPPAPFLSARVGSRLALAAALGLIGAFGLARALVPGAAGLILLTFPVGMGMGLAGAMLPVAVKERFADRPVFATGVYTTGISLGSAISTAIAVPVAHAAGGWRAPLLAFSAFAAGLTAVWLALTRRELPHMRTGVRPVRLPWRSGLAWQLVAAFFLMSFVFYGLNSWLPDAYVERGWSEGEAGALLAVLNGVTIPCGLVVAWLADRFGSRRLWLGSAAGVQLAGMLGVVLAPGGGFAWAALMGAAIGPLFPLTMTLPLDVSDRPAEVGAVAGMMLGLGYSLSAVGPFALGAVRDATGGFATTLWLIAAAAAALLAMNLSFTRERLGAARPSRERPAPAAFG